MRLGKIFPISMLFLFAAPIARAQFNAAPMLPVPGLASQTAAAAGNFNGDAFQDLAVAYQGGIAVFLGTGPGTYGTALLHPGMPALWQQVLATDLNSDGLTDLVVAPKYGEVTLLIADGSGSFTVVPLSAGSGGSLAFSGVGLADTNHDGHADVVAPGKFIGEETTLSVYVSLGDGAGNFGAWTGYAVGAGKAGQIAVADVNGDGAADALIAHKEGVGVRIALNDGNGAFGPSSLVPTGAEPRGIALADFDGDGKADLAVANSDSATLSILKGDGAGGFVVIYMYPGPADSTSVVTADFNGDGRLDLAVGGPSVWTYLGNGAGAFGEPGRYVAEGLPWVADLDADGRPDLLAGNSEVFNLGGGLFAAPLQFKTGSEPRALALADLSGEGFPDIVTANAGSNDISVLYGLGDGTFTDPVSSAVGSEPRSITVGDFNGDGRPDVAVANRLSGDVSILLGTPTGLGAATSLPTGGQPLALATSDFNGDGKLDLLVARAAPDGVAVFFATGTGSFVPGPQYPLPYLATALALGSFNPDVRPDAAVGMGTGQGGLFSLLGSGAGFLQPQLQTSFACDPGAIAVGDVNGDGSLDLAVSACSAQLLRGDGQGGFTPLPVPPVSGGGGVAIADFTRDGKPDVLFGGGFAGGGSIGASLLVGDGSGAFGPLTPTISVGGAAGQVAAADFDGDGHPDLAVGLQAGNAITILLNRPAPPGADLSLTITHAPDPIPGPSPLTLTATVTNQGPLAATAPVLTFQLPFGVTLVSTNPGAPTCQTSQPNQMNILVTCSFGDVPPGGNAVLVVDVTIDVSEDELPFDAAAVSPTLDSNPLDNAVHHLVQVGLRPDLAVTLSDSVDPVNPGDAFDYVLDVTNIGAGTAYSVFLTGTLDSVTYVTSNPMGYCSGGLSGLTCYFGAILPGSSLQVAITVVAGTFTSVSNSVIAETPFDANLSDNTADEETRGALGIQRELAHGSALTESLPSGTPAERLYFVRQQPHASYEVVVDATAGDVAGTGQTVLLQRLGIDLSPLQDAQAAGVGQSRTLHWENASDQGVDAEVVRVRSTGCSTGCGPGDTYRIRAWETTAQISRFNTTVTQTTVLVLENRIASPVQGHVWLWDEDGLLVGSVPFSLGGHQALTSNLATVVPGRKGAVTISHDGGYGAIAGKAVAIEPATGFTFDTPLRDRPR